MQLAILQTHISPFIEEFEEKFAQMNLLFYASEAGVEMEFDSIEELNEAVKSAMELFLSAAMPIKGNFLRIYKSTGDGIAHDWRLSPLAYKLVCMCGSTSNPNVARTIIQLIKNEHLNHF